MQPEVFGDPAFFLGGLMDDVGAMENLDGSIAYSNKKRTSDSAPKTWQSIAKKTSNQRWLNPKSDMKILPLGRMN